MTTNSFADEDFTYKTQDDFTNYNTFLKLYNNFGQHCNIELTSGKTSCHGLKVIMDVLLF